jgi:hypothetical protein
VVPGVTSGLSASPVDGGTVGGLGRSWVTSGGRRWLHGVADGLAELRGAFESFRWPLGFAGGRGGCR